MVNQSLFTVFFYDLLNYMVLYSHCAHQGDFIGSQGFLRFTFAMNHTLVVFLANACYWIHLNRQTHPPNKSEARQYYVRLVFLKIHAGPQNPYLTCSMRLKVEMWNNFSYKSLNKINDTNGQYRILITAEISTLHSSKCSPSFRYLNTISMLYTERHFFHYFQKKNYSYRICVQSCEKKNMQNKWNK